VRSKGIFWEGIYLLLPLFLAMMDSLAKQPYWGGIVKTALGTAVLNG